MEKIIYKHVEYSLAQEGLVSEYFRTYMENKYGEYSDVEPEEEMVEKCIEWLKTFATHKRSVNKQIGSYGLKHVVERWAKTYISNGAFILAAYRLGYTIIPNDIKSPNARFRIIFAKGSIK